MTASVNLDDDVHDLEYTALCQTVRPDKVSMSAILTHDATSEQSDSRIIPERTVLQPQRSEVKVSATGLRAVL